MPIGAAIGALGSMYGANKAAEGSEKAAQAQMYATMVQKQMFDQAMARQEPFYQQGLSSLEDYAKMLKGGYDMKESPAAQYELQQGTKAMNRQLASRGMLGGGTAANRLAELSSGIAARDWHNQYSRLVDSLKLGTGAAASMNQSGQVYGGQIGGVASNLSNIYQLSGMNQAGLYSSAAQNLANTLANAGSMAAGIGIKMGWGGK